MRRKKRKLTKAEILDRAISAWEQRQEGAVIMLRKSAEMLLKLRRQRQRLHKRKARDVVWPSGEPVKSGDIEPGSAIEIEVETGTVIAVEPPEDIPGFLDRTSDKDAAAREEIKAQQAEKKKRAAEHRIAKLKIGQETKHAELTGQRRRMPLSGKEALAAIRAK